MTLEKFKELCLAYPEVTLEFPFDETTLVCKVAGKMFALADTVAFGYINVKCDPEDAMAYRDAFEGVTPGYHMNKRHWNSVSTGGDVPDELIARWIGDSYGLVVSKLPARVRERINRGGVFP